MSDPIKVTLSGNSTPLLQNPFAPAYMGNTQSVPLNGLVEADSRLAIEQGKGLTNSQGAVVLGLLGELRARLDEHIAKSTKAVSMLLDANARLAEAEARAVRAEEACRVLAEECADMREREPIGPSTNPGIVACRKAVDANPAARAAVEEAQ